MARVSRNVEGLGWAYWKLPTTVDGVEVISCYPRSILLPSIRAPGPHAVVDRFLQKHWRNLIMNRKPFSRTQVMNGQPSILILSVPSWLRT